MENAKQKAIEVVEKYKGLVYPYLGSGMLTNTEDSSVILENAKQCALISAKEIISELSDLPKIPYNERKLDFWQEVKSEIEKHPIY